jgi:hypothetical protein
VTSANYEAHHYVVLSILLSLAPLWAQILPSACCSQTPPVCVLPSVWQSSCTPIQRDMNRFGPRDSTREGTQTSCWLAAACIAIHPAGFEVSASEDVKLARLRIQIASLWCWRLPLQNAPSLLFWHAQWQTIPTCFLYIANKMSA